MIQNFESWHSSSAQEGLGGVQVNSWPSQQIHAEAFAAFIDRETKHLQRQPLSQVMSSYIC